ncbi:UDP-glucose:Glyco protein glucosyltransferase-domain-containing protein [Aspergillus pseudotamarii]|uniref:UDP-glucose:Glyco protein glucosyltransferase-domain-containing protein n=1 Tax=Aspergillus pseudotamarii TaxID=132259 RepID=A0A5N6TCQ2_ASPPS|nr:UDP-glucose:Glyco protein glucosyltransferase-domain-containing protein [Aspergillus pseudotamarii]KAE8144057.1 UDP-glucose:Glyco protein glucosyltransferase-domain-containing protein [Aspergillus pseudotamarii]
MISGIGSVASWRLSVIVAAVLTSLVHASSSVNVALQASFDSAPYLIELLETAAEENATAYFPLLDRIADGAFDDAVTDKEVYDRFLQVIHDDGHLRTSESLSSFKLSLAIRSASPRIAAHYQYYNASVQHSLMAAQDAACPVWVHSDGKQYCSSTMERAQQDVSGDLDPRELPFDRVLGDTSLPPAVLYADVASPMFKDFHQTLSALVKEGQISYRVRYRPPQHWSARPLFVSGYGVELALKRTDYIVIDDRDAGQKEASNGEANKVGDIEGDAPDDLRPLSSSEVSRLGVNTVSYVMDSDNPLDTLVKLSQDFPKYSAKIAAHNATTKLLQDIRSSRLGMLPSGVNVMWINGVQMDPRKIDAYSLLDHLRRERRLIEKFRDLEISAQEAVDLLSHKLLGESLEQDAPQRYNYRDDIEGGGVLIWLNDLEKDAKYDSWPGELGAFLRPTFPGQLPPVRRDAHNIVVPVDLTDTEDMNFVVKTIQVFVKRKIPVRFGLVPVASSPGSTAQLKVAHYLQETFGLASLIQYLEESLSANKIASPDKTSFQLATKERKVRADKSALSLAEVLKHEKLDEIVSRTVNYQNRLRITGGSSLIFINGVPVIRDDNWVQEMSNRVGKDLQSLQQGIMDNTFEEDVWLPEFFLSQAFDRRNPWVIPEDPKDIRVVDLAKVSESQKGGLSVLPRIASDKDDALDSVHMIVVGDFDSESGAKLLTAVLESRQKHSEVEILFLHNPAHVPAASGSISVYHLLKESQKVDVTQILGNIGSSGTSLPAHKQAEIARFWALQQPLAGELGFTPGASGVVINGRAAGPIPADYTVVPDDFDQLLAYERTKRIDPVSKAVKELEIGSKLSGPLAFAKLTSLATLSTISDVPEGIFESTTDVRMNLFDKWNDSQSVVTVSNSEDAAITIVASIDPTSEVAQRWLPILKVLSELASVRLRLFLNAREEIQELPIKRFYRYVLDPEPSFASNGAVLRPGASFSGVPVEALLTLGMDVPSSWLVAPKDSVHDLDNIKLSTLKAGSNVDAIYALEHILIEGHSRDMTTKTPPRGVQLALGTQENPYFADTIIMANLGYFQFKAQPGLWQINLKPGRSERIFKLDSVGGMGYAPQPGDENNEVALLSFQGKTLFPRLSRKKGHESEDVLDTNPKPGSAMDYVSKGLNFASGILSSVGAGSKLSTTEKQADINIFSVASGHLYERMLNIMMVSVMRNTKHSVKFWFIEQFLSPSFKSFLPHLAKEYGFSYEMVTFKWPHWLRAQREKQREIWGYKILFLDVLFPLSLDKVIFVDADQVVRTDMYDLVNLDLEGAPYGFTPMCDSRHEMEGFRFWKQGYWKNFLRGQPYHISALYVVDLSRFRALAAGDRLRGQYQMLSADPNSLSNLDQDLPNHMQHHIPIKSLPQEWLWCETWCSDESLGQARTIDLCNNPQTKEPKLDRARRQVPEWTEYDEEIAALVEKVSLEQQQSEEAQPDDEEDEDDGEWTKDEL